MKAFGMYTLRQVCELTSLSRSTIYRLRDEGVFVAAKRLSNGRIGFPIAEVHRWLAERSSDRFQEDQPEDN
jgi:excisionase family DNA binding protein